MNPWKNLSAHFSVIAETKIKDLFESDPDRTRRYAIELEDLFVDYSKHRFNDETLSLLMSLAEVRGLNQWIYKLFNGDIINTSEKRAALHTSLRDRSNKIPGYTNADSTRQVLTELDRIESFINKLHAGKITGYTGKAIKTLVNIGIGGSDLGPRLAYEALADYRSPSLQIKFISNIDVLAIGNALRDTDPEATLFIVSSKSFSTEETMTNANTARNWLIENRCTNVSQHFIAVTANRPAAEKFGIDSENIFTIWDWVGGRYSVWSATGLPVVASIGMDNFHAMLDGASRMDEHFHNEPFARNIPILLGLLDIWYINFFNTETIAIIPYTESLQLLPEYLAQLMMESNGKSVDQEGQFINHKTAPIVWGGVGTRAQHSFMQLLHQGTRLVPVEFIVGMSGNNSFADHQKILFSNCIAQGAALMMGNADEKHIPGNKFVAGNKPSTTIIYDKLTPRMLGMLLAMYEHRTFVQACIWQINPFDQWGVELGKQISGTIMDDLNSSENNLTHDPSTCELIKKYRDYQRKNKLL